MFLFISIITLSKLGNNSGAVLVKPVIRCQSGNQQVLTENGLFTLLKPEGLYHRFKTPLYFSSASRSLTQTETHTTHSLYSPPSQIPHIPSSLSWRMVLWAHWNAAPKPSLHSPRGQGMCTLKCFHTRRERLVSHSCRGWHSRAPFYFPNLLR